MLQRALRSYQTLQTETAVNAASPSGLIVLVYDRILEHLREAVSLMSQGQDSSAPVQKALDLITEGLVAALDVQRGGEVADNLAALYDWSTRTLLRARLRRDVALLEDVINVLMPLRNAWVVVSGKEPTSV